jgi:AcrR family transcriptional regulator
MVIGLKSSPHPGAPPGHEGDDTDERNTAATQHRLRADALRNRSRIIDAARDVFTENGVDAPLDEVARRAAVGNATLYRHFSDRRQLVLAVALAVKNVLAEEARAALAEEPDAFSALRRYVHRSADKRAGAFFSAMSGLVDMDEPAIREAGKHLAHAVEQIMDAARTSGQLRDDVTLSDLLIPLTQLTRPLPGSGCADLDRFVHRHLDLFLDGLRAPPRTVLPGPAVKLDDLHPATRMPTPRH